MPHLQGTPCFAPGFVQPALPWPPSSRSPWWFAAVAVSVSRPRSSWTPGGTSGTKAGRIRRLACGKRDGGDPVSSLGLYHDDWALYRRCLSTSSPDDTRVSAFL